MSGNYRGLLRRRGFKPLLATVFLGALTDNLYKIVVALIAVDLGAERGGSTYLALTGLLFVLPYLLFAGYAGYLADIFNKRSVLIATKAFEILAMLAAFHALKSGNIELMLGVIFLTALQSVFFNPAHYGILPEMLPDRELSRANGLDEMATFLAIVLGTMAGALLYDQWRDGIEAVAIVLILLAILGSLTSLGIGRVPGPVAKRKFPALPWIEVIDGIRHLLRNRAMTLAVLGISYFWFLGALLQLGIVLFGKEVMALDDFETGLLQPAIAIGIGLGSIAAGRLSGDKVELGLVPLGSLGIGFASLLLAASPPSYPLALSALALLGFAAGLFIVPLNAFLQQRAEAHERGRIIATNNFISMFGVALAAGVFWLLSGRLALPADDIVLLIGLATFAATAYVLYLLPDFLVRFTLWLLAHSLYRIRIAGAEHVPQRGPALLVCNHVSLVDGLLVGACIQRFVRFIVYRRFHDMPGLRWLFRLMKAIPISAENPKLVVAALERARAELRAGHVVCIFAEGAISRTGNMLAFRRGFERIMEGVEAPIIPVHLDRVWGSIFSFRDGRFIWKWPRRLPLPVTVSFGAPLPAASTAWQVRQAILELGSAAAALRRSRDDLLHLQFLRTAKARWRAPAIADSTGASLGFGRALVASLALAQRLRRHCPEDSMIGVLLPASVGGALANTAVLFAGKTAVNLNFTAGPAALGAAVAKCRLRAILTSRIFLEKAGLPARADMLFMEDLAAEIAGWRKLVLAAACWLLPRFMLIHLFDLRRQEPDDPAAILFSSGSTGEPKGAMLSHANILSNVEAVAQVLWIDRDDKMMGVLPFFHAFGLTGTIWIPLISGIGAAYHANPLDAKTIGRQIERHKATILISTPTFCQAYLRVCTPDDFASLRHVVVGAEKLQPALAAAFEEKFGLTLLEGYGCTEMAPVVAVNGRDVEHDAMRHVGHRPGTVGHPIPGIAARTVDPDTGEEKGPDQEGLLLVKGPGRMLGYLDDPLRTAQAFRDGWYVTGDIAAIDRDGFIRITDRLARFSKIGGEMVPHTKVEDLVSRLPGIEACAVTATEDAQKGERLVLFYVAGDGVEPATVWQALSATDMPKLWLPKPRDIHRLDDLPKLATGKLDLQAVKRLARERAAAE
jgi:acyl-[acyl-carrier-protein]-phospholipid O-acyltransferase/long-chain-fatty-acid--[acyl-carrier-protein] ligase